MGTTHFSGTVSAAAFSGPQSGTTVAATTSLTVGSGTAITKIVKGTVTVDLASLATVTAADKAITITGAATGDTVILTPPTTAMTAGMLICQAWVSATNTVTARIYNASGGTIDEASATWGYCLIRS